MRVAHSGDEMTLYQQIKRMKAVTKFSELVSKDLVSREEVLTELDKTIAKIEKLRNKFGCDACDRDKKFLTELDEMMKITVLSQRRVIFEGGTFG